VEAETRGIKNTKKSKLVSERAEHNFFADVGVGVEKHQRERERKKQRK